jgi:hypothetical protein
MYLDGRLQDEDVYAIYDQLVGEYGAVTYEAFINLLVRCPFSLIRSHWPAYAALDFVLDI